MIAVQTIDTSNLTSLEAAIDAAADAAMTAALGVIGPAIASETPVRTGFLRNSERVYQRGTSTGVFAASAEYASFVANGTTRQRANPFIDRGVEQSESQAVAVYEATFSRVMGALDG